MILRKPYAFLIKYFKLIHLLMTIPMAYLIYKSYGLVNFLSESIANNYYSIASGEIAGLYINYFMYGAIIITLIALVAIYYLLSHKDKPRKFYMYAILYYIILFILFTIFYSFLNTLSSETIASSSLRAYRDISLISALPQIFFAIYVLVSATGFNIKKFNFGDDLKELEISEDDNEEFEFILNKDNYKTKRNIRKMIREFIYYIRENTFVFLVIVSVVIIIIGTSIFLNREVYDKEYRLNQSIGHNNFTVSILDSIVTNLSYNGEKLSEDKYYVVVKVSATNNGSVSRKLDTSNFRLVVDNTEIKPELEKSLYFKDYANPYYGNDFSKGDSRTISLVYEINKKQIKNKYVLKMFRGVRSKPGEITAMYNEIDLKPVLLDEIGDANSVLMNEKLEFVYSNLNNYSIQINSFQFNKSYLYTYETCVNDNCKTLSDIVSIDYNSSSKYRLLLVMDYEMNLDKESLYYKYNSSIKDFINDFLKVKYTIDNQTYYTKVIYNTPNTLKDKIVVQLDEKVANATNVELVFTIRNKNYNILLK